MKNPERVIIPLTIGAAIIGIWAAFRRTPTVIQESSGGFQLPPIPPLVDTHFGIPFSDYASPARTPRGGHISDGRYINNSAANPLAQNPSQVNINLNAAPNPAAYLTFNMPSWDVTGKADARREENAAGFGVKPGGGAGGCGGCGGCGGNGNGGFFSDPRANLIRKCSRDCTPRLMDGHGDCLTTFPMFENKAAIGVNTQYVAASYDVPLYGVPGDYHDAYAGTVLTAVAGT